MTAESIGIWLFGLAAIVIVSTVLLRWIFYVDTFLKYQKAQTVLLIELAKKQEVDKARVDAIIKDLNAK